MQPTQHSEMFSSSTLLFVTVVVSLHFCLRPYFTPRWHFGVTDKTCPSSFCIFRVGLRGGVRKWRWKRALGRRVYRFTVDTSRGSPQSRVSSDTQRDNGMLSKYFKKLRAAPPCTPSPLLWHPLCYRRRPQSWLLICNEREDEWGGGAWWSGSRGVGNDSTRLGAGTI